MQCVYLLPQDYYVKTAFFTYIVVPYGRLAVKLQLIMPATGF